MTLSSMVHLALARVRRGGALTVPAFLCLACLWPACVAAQAAADSGRDAPDRHQRVPLGFAEGQTIEQVYVHVVNPGPDAARNEQMRTQVEDAFGILPGSAFNELIAESALRQVRALAAVETVELRVYSVGGGHQVAVALLVTIRPEREVAPPAATGVFATGRARDLPKLWQDDRSLVRLVVNPSVGAYGDLGVWLGNPGAFVGLPDKDSTGVVEGGLELGVGGITRVGNSNTYVYGRVSYVGSTTMGRDVFSDDTDRAHVGVEDLYGGLLVAAPGAKRRLNVSMGRQEFSLNRNLLIGHVLGASNGGDRAASNLSPRNAYDMTVDARLQLDHVTLQAWLADPDELPASDSRSRYAGLNFRFNDNRRLDATLTFLAVPRSDAAYFFPDGSVGSRGGLRAINPRVRWTSAFSVPGFWVEGEWAHQWHADFDMSADGGGVWLGYQRTAAAWKPAVLYRYAVFTGDDPGTATYERFDSLTGGVQRDWAQGLDMVKVGINRNMRTHRVEVSVKPRDGVEFSIDYYDFTADTANNLGGQRPVSTYGSGRLSQEVTPTLQWMVGSKLFIQGLATFLVPGPGLSQVLPEPTRTWKTFQLSFYWFL